MSGKITLIVGEEEVPITGWDLSFGYGVPASTTLRFAPQFRFGDAIRYRSLGREVYMVLTADPENGDLLDILAFDDGHVYRNRKDPAMWEIVE